MIQETRSRRDNPAITSDRWYVAHSRWTGNPSGEPSFERTIVSEYDDRVSAVKAARKLLRSIATELAKRPRATRDQILVRAPGNKILKLGKRIDRTRK